MSRTRLSHDEIDAALQSLEGWRREDAAIVREFTFPSYEAGVAFAVQVALYAQRIDHHPDLLITWQRVTVTWSTHDAGGVTRRDLDAAAHVSGFVRAQSSPSR